MQTLEQAVEAYFVIADKYFKRSFQRPTIQLSKRVSRVAGSANLTRNHLRFNQHYYQDNQAHFLKQTVGHEVAHLVCYQVFGQVQPHGREWQAVMLQVFNLSPERTHQYQTKPGLVKTFSYSCLCQQHQLSLIRHNKVLRGQQYICRRCRKPLQSES